MPAKLLSWLRWDVVAVGVVGIVVGLGVGLGISRHMDAGLSTMIGAAAGSLFPAAIALSVIHYKQQADERQYEKFVLSVIQELHDDAQVLNRICTLYMDGQHPALIPKAQAQAEVLLEVIGVLERDVSQSGHGSFELRRFLFQLQKHVNEAKREITEGQSKRDDEMMSSFQSAGSLLEDRAHRYHDFLGRFRWLTEKEIEMRMWAVDHE